MAQLLSEGLARFVALIWLERPAQSLLVVPPRLRSRVRNELTRSTDCLRHARTAERHDARARSGAEALACLLRAVSLATGLPNEADAAQVGRAHVEQALGTTPLGETLQAWTCDDDKLPLDDQHFSALCQLCEFIESIIDARSPREAALGRLALWGSLVLLLGLGAWGLLGSKNIAYGKPVSASSICPETPAPPYHKQRLFRAVDGVQAEAAFAVCTAFEKHPWIMVDLETERTLHSALIYGRSDCCWGDKDLPAAIEISLDGQSFSRVAATRTPFTDDLPWRASLGNRRARFVRLSSPSPAPRGLVIGEFEIHGY